ncbi:MAG: transcriptional regulator [Acidobacteria bacterium]|nr:MAG: transcriptional regulator [Acidobacteriota bacterium]
MPDLAGVARLIGDPARARMLTALMSGKALTATELSLEANVSASTASSHLSKLTGARLIAIEKQGRHRYFRLFSADVASALEELACVARQPRTGPTDPALRVARVCYDHLAGERGVWMYEQLQTRKLFDDEKFFANFGIDLGALTHSRRPLTRTCLDWSERRHHLGGSLGAAVLDRILALRWAKRELDSRALVFTARGADAFRAMFSA